MNIYTVQEYYESTVFQKLLELPKNPKQNHFRFLIKKENKIFFLRIKDRIYNKGDLLRWVIKLKPLELYMTPNTWLNPVFIGRNKNELDIMLCSHLYLDIDVKGRYQSIILKKAHKRLNMVLKYFKLKYNKTPNNVHFSGGKGFHVIFHNWDWDEIKNFDPKERINQFIINRKKIWVEMKNEGIITDIQTIVDPYRLLKIPGSLNIKTGIPAFKLTKEEWYSFSTFNQRIKEIKKNINIFKINLMK